MGKKFLSSLSLRMKFVLALGLFSLMLQALTILLNYQNNTTVINAELQKKANVMAEMAVMATKYSLMGNNIMAITANVEALFKDNEICLVEIIDSDGLLVYQKSREKELDLRGKAIKIFKDIEIDGEIIGKITIGITSYHRKRAILANMVNNFVISALLTLFVGMITTYYIIKDITGPVNDIVSVLTEGADQVAAASVQLATASRELSAGSAEQAGAFEETSSTLYQAASMIQQNNANLRRAAQLSGETNEAAKNGREEMETMTSAIDDIKRSSDQIAKIVKIIDDIAFQTNILALNAAIEAARAGEAGQGFAVVAEEVRTLAQRSAQAAKETAAMIETNIELSMNGVMATEQAKAALDAITAQTRMVSELMEEIAAASQEQAKGIEQIKTAIAQMNNVTERNAANAEESAIASQNLKTQAQSLRNIIQQLSALVNGGPRQGPAS